MSLWKKLQIAAAFGLLILGISFFLYPLLIEEVEEKIVPFRNEVAQAIEAQGLPYTVSEKDEREFKKAKKEGALLVTEDLKVFLGEIPSGADGSIISKTFIGKEWDADRYRLPRHIYWIKLKRWNGTIAYEVNYDFPSPPALFSPKTKGRFVGTSSEGVIFEFSNFSSTFVFIGVGLFLAAFLLLGIGVQSKPAKRTSNRPSMHSE